jgi:UDP-N-acetyl-D-glucosamine dehydrogenase
LRKVGVVGLGYVGLPLLVEIALSGLEAIGIDIDPAKCQAINDGENYIDDVDSSTLQRLVSEGQLQATTDWDVITHLDAVIVCVPTPLRKTKDPDISFIVGATQQIAPRLRTGHVVVLESTTYPGTTEELVLPEFSKGGLRVGTDFFLAFSPERVDPGNSLYKTRNTPKVLGGITPACLDQATKLYQMIFDRLVPVSSTRAAEMVKLLENTFRSVNIGLVNEFAIMCDKLGLNVWEIIDAAATKPFGFMPFQPGPGLGGHCIPIDPHYLAWKMKTVNYTARFIELASEVNTSMPHHVVEKVAESLNLDRKSINGSKIFVLGVSYKAGVRDVRESPAIDIIGLLQERGGQVSYHDPYVPSIDEGHIRAHSVDMTDAALTQADCVLVVTNHPDIDWNRVAEKAPVVVDCRNALKKHKARGRLVLL